MSTKIEYEVFIRVRARKGNAVTGDLLPELLVMETDELSLALLSIQMSIDVNTDSTFVSDPIETLRLADKVHRDIVDNKYKWTVNVEVE